MKRRKVTKSHLLFLFLLLIIFNGLYPYKRKAVILNEGDIANKDIIAPISFKILKSEEQLEEERKKAASEVEPILHFIGLPDSVGVMKEIDSILSNNNTIIRNRFLRNKSRIKSIFLDVYSRGIISSKERLPESENSRFQILKGDTSLSVVIDSIRDVTEAREQFAGSIKDIIGTSRYANEVISHLRKRINPNLLIDFAETEKMRREARNSISDSIGVVRKGEKIVGAHEIVGQEEYRKLYSLRQKQSREYPYSIMSNLLRNQLYFLLIGLFVLGFLYIREQKVFQSRRYLYLFLINIVVILTLYRFLPLYLLPLSSVVMFFTLAVDLDFGILIAVTSTLIIALYQEFAIAKIIPVLTGSLVGGVLLIDSRNREDWYRTGAVVGITTGLMVLALEFYTRSNLKDVLTGLGYGLTNGILSILILFALLFLFERFFNITTNFTWMEYSDLNNPLLKRLSREASGTYQHSLMVSTLAENAAEAIGANPLLSRVAGLYHDIGKLERPGFFAENFRSEENPHDSIPPKLSSIIIKSHVHDGVRIAEEYSLPKEIINIIREHQGNGLIVPFYEKAHKYMDEIDEDDFRYDSDLPVSKEAGIVMLADMVEATVRSMDSPDEEEIVEMIEKHVNKQFSRGQLSKSELSINDLDVIVGQFAQTLQGLYHHRPTYPESE